jgi:hypothetical protein
MTDQSIEDASRKDFEAAYRKSYAYRGDKENDFQLRRNTLHPDNYYEHDVIHAWEIWQAARQSSQSEPVATADYIAYLYSDGNKLKVAEEMPPPDNAFPVFTTNIRFLDVARIVLSDNVDLILEHGGVELWEALVTKVNKDYAEKNHEQ